MGLCDCAKPIPHKTRQDIVCRGCGVFLDQIYENDIAFEKVAHLTNPMLHDIHPSINKTLSTLSQFIDMEINTRIMIIDRANQIVGNGINYIEATKLAFLEMFPKVDIGFNQKKKNNIQIHKHINSRNPILESKESKLIINQRKRIEKVNRMNVLIKRGKKKNQTIEEIAKKVKFPKSTYYRNRKIKLIIKPKSNGYHMTNSTKITSQIHEYIFKNLDKTLKELQLEISCLFSCRERVNGKFHITKVHLDTSTIWRHIHKHKINNH